MSSKTNSSMSRVLKNESQRLYIGYVKRSLSNSNYERHNPRIITEIDIKTCRKDEKYSVYDNSDLVEALQNQ